jgi:ketosteroid isomerase-like protein
LGRNAVGVGDKVKEVTSSAKRRVGAEAPLAADEDGKIGVVRGALRAFGEGDMEKFVDALKDDVVWESPEGENFPGAGEHQGPDEVRKSYLGDVGRTYTSFGFRPETFLETDKEDAVVVIGRFEGDGVEGGNVSTPGVQIWGFTGTEVTHVRIFADSAAFPEVVTEEKEKEWAEEDRKKEEEEKKDDDDSGDDSKSESDDDTKSESDDDTKSESKDDSKSESDDKSKDESKNGKPEAKSDDDSSDDDDSDDDDSDDKDDDS